jgi:carbamoyltransferase
MSVILGINAFHPGASAALIVDGKPVAAIAEERLNRVKYYARFPKLSILRCLEMAGLGLGDVDHVAVGREPSAPGKKINLFSGIDEALNLMKIRTSRDASTISRAIASGAASTRALYASAAQRPGITSLPPAPVYLRGTAAGFTIDGSGDFVVPMTAARKPVDVKHRI